MSVVFCGVIGCSSGVIFTKEAVDLCQLYFVVSAVVHLVGFSLRKLASFTLSNEEQSIIFVLYETRMVKGHPWLVSLLLTVLCTRTVTQSPTRSARWVTKATTSTVWSSALRGLLLLCDCLCHHP